jgi:hypothetical protein
MLDSGNIDVQADGDILEKSKKNISIEADEKSTIKGKDVELNGKVLITGGTLECNGAAAPTGTGCWCAQPYCLVTGAPQSGNKATGT